MGDEPGAPPLEEEGVQSRGLSGNQFGMGWGGGQGGGGYRPPGVGGGIPFTPGYGYPAVPRVPVPYEGGGSTVPGYGYGYPPGPTAPPVPTTGASGDGLYPVIGFNPRMLFPTAKSYMECPVCMEVLMKPIYQCSNGHVVCNICIEKLSFCGQCRVSLAGPRIRNVALEQISESMVMKCPNHLDGCGAVASGEQLKSHLEVCEFRAIQLCSTFLGFPDCFEKVTTVVAPVHLREVHQADAVDNSKFSMKLVGPSSIFASLGQGATWGPIVVTSAFDTDIVLKCQTTAQGYLSLTGYLIGCSEDSHKMYRVKFQINSQRSRVEWTGGLLSIRHHNLADHLPNVNTFQVPLLTLKEFTKPHHEDDLHDLTKLKVKVAFWKLSEVPQPYRECFVNSETGVKEPMQKLILRSKPNGGSSQNPFPMSQAPSSPAYPAYPTHPTVTPASYAGVHDRYDSTASHYPSHNTCTNCRRPMNGVFYQCLQCPEATFYCRQCTEVSRAHEHHLTLRIPTLDQQPLAAVVYECASGDIN